MSDTAWLEPMFKAIDKMDAAAFAAFLAEDVRFTFGSGEPVVGRQESEAAVAGFFSSIAGLQHEITDRWCIDNDAMVRGRVTYTRHDGSKLAVPFANVFKIKGDLIDDYQIYIDISTLYAS
ncbi:hypothetical protein BOW53_12595 [Solemya pervernicosa gill symbiont]|uniref:SnoaL-like domain-containing protein n=2 Tax=Gammaproteobacteria incertae sedis TaxID=118884 RepID=A0A1T2L288_9GAMM|nr:nuclear transport factor 2 family protein [Candidatus Reidiella endopervernicosa]OOZ39215.1 hypothetical protein BOW53_12595 [Solemya pervernicosa gill symbiont]QKQ28063.1 nuclear transport factor 2 family protein [Candidatus Reidiella endopervernicosa]